MAQNVTVAGASYPDVPSLVLPKTGGGTAAFLDTSDATATASQILSGYTAYAGGSKLTGTATAHASIDGTYDSSTKALTLTATGVTDTWFGAIEAELLYEYRASYKPKDAANWPITPTTTAQNLTWTTSYTTTANANAVWDRYGNNYHGGTALDYGQYSYVWLCSAFVNPVYTVDEATMGTAHIIGNAMETVVHYASRPRVSSGNIVWPTASTYGTYGNTSTQTLLSYYRSAAGAIGLANNATYGISLAYIAPQQASTSSVKPNYVNFRNPTIGIRANDTYMELGAYNYVDWDKTKVEYRARFYRVPVGYGLYNMQNDRMLRTMILGGTFPAEPL